MASALTKQAGATTAATEVQSVLTRPFLGRMRAKLVRRRAMTRARPERRKWANMKARLTILSTDFDYKLKVLYWPHQ